MKKILVFLAEGCEEVEALAPVDLLRRAGAEVHMASVSGSELVTGSHGISVKSDLSAKEADISEYDGLMLPGGAPGFKNLQASEAVKNAVLKADAEGKLVSAICAAPTVLGAFGVLKGRKACCYPGMEEGLTGAEVSMDRVVVDKNLITARGMGVAVEFGLELVAYLFDRKTAENLAVAVVQK